MEAADANVTSSQESTMGAAARQRSVETTDAFLLYLPNPIEHGAAGPGEGDAARRFAAVAEQFGYRLYRRRPFVLACRKIARERHDVDDAAAADSLILDLFPGTIASGRRLSADGGGAGPGSADQGGDWAAWHAMAEREAQFYNLIGAADSELRIESDPIGLKPFYIAALDHGTLIASRILDILRAAPELAAPVDPLAVYQLMMFRAPMGERTLHQRVKRSISGGCYRWSPERGLQVTQGRRLSAPPVDAGLFVDDALERIKEALVRSLREKAANLSGPIALSLSGGFDSRLLAAVAVEIGLPVQAYSFGRSYHPEIQSAKATARTLGLPLEILPYPADGSIQRLPFHLETVEGTADLATSLIANLFAIDRPAGTPMLHGFAGDPIAGNHLRHLAPKDYRTLDTLADGVMRFNGGASPIDFAALLNVPVSRDAVRDEIRASLPEGCQPHQAYTLWDFEHKQRRYVGSHFPMIGDRFDTIAPYYDRDLFAIWLSVPPVGLDGRSLFRKFLTKYYPALARIPHSEEAGPITPNLRYQLAGFLRKAPYEAVDRLFGTARARRLTRALSRDRYIWSLANLAGARQRAHMLARIEALRPDAQQVLGLDIDARFADRLKGDLQATRGLFLVMEYAAWLRQQGSFAT
jgi:hypothetical protein